MKELIATWRDRFGDVPPGGRVWAEKLTRAQQERLVRLHSLPGSKRYAACSAEMALILSRQNDLLELLIGAGTSYAIFFTRYGGEGEIHAEHYSRLCDDRLTLLFTVQPDRCTPEPFFDWRPAHAEVRLYARQQPWRREAEDAILAAVADDEIAGPLLFCPERDILFAPYDGGFTVLAASKAQRRMLEERFADWLPGGSEEDHSLVIASAQNEHRETVRWLIETLDATVYLSEGGSVTTVNLSHHRASDDTLFTIGTLHDLQHLHFSPTSALHDEDNLRVTDKGIQALHGLSQLKGLVLEAFPALTEAGVEALREALPDCEVYTDTST